MKRKKILAISIVCVLLIGGGSVGGKLHDHHRRGIYRYSWTLGGKRHQ